LFVALDLPSEVRDGLAAWQRAELNLDELRPARAETLHMTLAFLGYRRERDVESIAALATRVETEAPEVRLLPEPVARPPRGRPRLFAIEAESPGAIELQSEVEANLVLGGFYEPEKRDFWPHLTVARVRPERRPPDSGGKGKRRRGGKPMRVTQPPGTLPDALVQPFRAVRVSLYRSLLRPSGAEYVSVAHVELPILGGGKRVEDGKATDPT
jgi:2'-5' RNA ligase